MKLYSCSNNQGLRFTISAPNADNALDRAVKQFHLNDKYEAPIIVSSLTDPCDYKSTNLTEPADKELVVSIEAAVEALFV